MPNQIVKYPVPLMLRKILKDKSNGELIVTGNNFTKSLFFMDGYLVFARTNVIEERLGEILFKIGKINREQFKSINGLIKGSSERVGKILVKNEMINQRDLFFTLVYQLRTIATSTFDMPSGEWEFRPEVPQIPEDSRFKIGLPGIITEGTNKIANIAYFKNQFFYKIPKLTTIPEAIKEFLSDFDIKFYNDLVQAANLSCERLLAKLKVAEDVFWKKIVLFYLLNIADFSDVVIDKDRDSNIEEILRIYEQLKSHRMDYYELLSLKHTANAAEIKSAYFDYAKKYHPDRIFSAPDPDIKEKANYVFAEINKAYETLSNTEQKMGYDSRGYKENENLDAVQDNLSEKARLLYRRAKALYAQKKYWEAASTMEEAVRCDSHKASYFLLLGLAQMNLPNLRRMAANHLQKTIDLEPWNVEAYAAMGLLFLSEKQLKRAEGFFRKVLSINPDHALARKKLDEIIDSTNDSSKKGKFSLFGKSKKS